MNRKMNEEISFKREKKRKNIFELKLTPSIVGNFSFSRYESREYIGFSSFFKVSFSGEKSWPFYFPLYICLLPPHFHPFASFFPSLQLSLCVEQWHWITRRSIISRIRNAKRLLTGHLLHTSRHRSIKNSIRAIERRNIVDTGLDNRYTRSRKYGNIL